MNSHKHAALTPRGRALLVYRVLHEGCKVRDASSAAGVSERTGYKWLARFKAEGHAGLSDRSSRPWRSPSSSIGSSSAAASVCRCGGLQGSAVAAWRRLRATWRAWA